MWNKYTNKYIVYTHTRSLSNQSALANGGPRTKQRGNRCYQICSYSAALSVLNNVTLFIEISLEKGIQPLTLSLLRLLAFASNVFHLQALVRCSICHGVQCTAIPGPVLRQNYAFLIRSDWYPISHRSFCTIHCLSFLGGCCRQETKQSRKSHGSSMSCWWLRHYGRHVSGYHHTR